MDFATIQRLEQAVRTSRFGADMVEQLLPGGDAAQDGMRDRAAGIIRQCDLLLDDLRGMLLTKVGQKGFGIVFKPPRLSQEESKRPGETHEAWMRRVGLRGEEPL